MNSNPVPPPPSEKEELRRAMRERLRAMGGDLRAEASLVISEIAAQLPVFRSGKEIALFMPLPTEPDIRPLIEEAWAQGKRVILPRMFRKGTTPHLDWHAVTGWEEMTEPGPFGLCEPNHLNCPRVEAVSLDCVFIPGVAFDKAGLRLGRGGSYYDCFLAQVAPTLPRFGLMFACQGVARVPREPHDQALPAIVTEDGVCKFSPSS